MKAFSNFSSGQRSTLVRVVMACGMWLVLGSLSACQAVSGLSQLEADRVSSAGTLATAANGVKSNAGRTGTAGRGDAQILPSAGKNSNAAASGMGGDPGRAVGQANVAGIGVPADDDAGVAPSGCSTRISYGSQWIHPPDRSGDSSDEAAGVVTWDGSCEVDASGNSFAQLSNGWRPFFTGQGACIIALDVRGSCAPADGCSTRIHYGSSWISADNHPDMFDDVAGVITSKGQCVADGEASYVELSNGWQPHFMGKDCPASLRYSQCAGLFANPIVDHDCPDPSVLHDGAQYVMACTSEGPEYPLLSSEDLVHWKARGSIFTAATKPAWAASDFWSPEIHHVGDRYLAYFSARHQDGVLAIGVASSSSAFGPYQASGEPLVRDSRGAVDAHFFRAADGAQYLLWRTDGVVNAEPTTIEVQALTKDGLALTGSVTTLLTNSEPWEGNMLQSPWLIEEQGQYYLFYNANDPSREGSSVAVARAPAVTGPYTKARGPSLGSGGKWAGPGMGSVIRARDDSWLLVFHAWREGQVGKAPGRLVLLTRFGWSDGWPSILGAPSSLSQPLP